MEGSQVPRRSGDGAVPRYAGIREGGELGGWSPRGLERGRLGSESVRRAEASGVLGAETEAEDRGSGERVLGVVGVGGREGRVQLLNSGWPVGPSSLHPQPKTLALVPPTVPLALSLIRV